MRNLLHIILSFSPIFLFGQNAISVYTSYSLPILNEFQEPVKKWIDEGKKIETRNFNLGLNFQVYRDRNFVIKLGFGYQYLNLIERDIIDSVRYKYEIFAAPEYYFATYRFSKDKPDLHNHSNRISTNLSFYYHFGKKNEHNIGFLTDIYFLEYYRAFYKSFELSRLRRKYKRLDLTLYDHAIDLPYKEYSKLLLNEEYSLSQNIFLSAVDLQLYYQYTLNFSEKFSLGFRASIGTNLYSDWNQFKKYVWVGFGVNFGFLSNEKVRVNKKMVLREVEKKE